MYIIYYQTDDGKNHKRTFTSKEQASEFLYNASARPNVCDIYADKITDKGTEYNIAYTL